MQRYLRIVFAAFLALTMTNQAKALPIMQQSFLLKYPQAAGTKLESCATCHQPATTGFVNAYGAALQTAKMDFAAVETLASPVLNKTFLDRIAAGQYPGSQADDAEVFVLPAKLGDVTFKHGEHIMNATFGIMGNCSTCHAAGSATAFPKVYNPGVVYKDQAHATCVECHKASGSANAPTKCLTCHKKSTP